MLVADVENGAALSRDKALVVDRIDDVARRFVSRFPRRGRSSFLQRRVAYMCTGSCTGKLSDNGMIATQWGQLDLEIRVFSVS